MLADDIVATIPVSPNRLSLDGFYESSAATRRHSRGAKQGPACATGIRNAVEANRGQANRSRACGACKLIAECKALTSTQNAAPTSRSTRSVEIGSRLLFRSPYFGPDCRTTRTLRGSCAPTHDSTRTPVFKRNQKAARSHKKKPPAFAAAKSGRKRTVKNRPITFDLSA
jgi:hypothetical protein